MNAISPKANEHQGKWKEYKAAVGESEENLSRYSEGGEATFLYVKGPRFTSSFRSGCEHVTARPAMPRQRAQRLHLDVLLPDMTLQDGNLTAASIWSRSIKKQHFGNKLEELWAEF